MYRTTRTQLQRENKPKTHKKRKEASTNDVDADDDNNNNKNNSMTTHPVVVATLLVLLIVPVDVPDASRSHVDGLLSSSRRTCLNMAR